LPDTRAWRTLDAADPIAAGLYVQWTTLQPLFAMLTLTAHANWANHLLRTLFKTRFRINVVVFPPDELHNHYTNRASDRWLAVSEWSPAGTLLSGVNASWPIAPRLTVILAEEFQTSTSGIRRKALIGPTPTFPVNKPTPATIIAAYTTSDYLWVLVQARGSSYRPSERANFFLRVSEGRRYIRRRHFSGVVRRAIVDLKRA
jgi:hypothetical protein